MTINKALLQQVLAKIEADPKAWDQTYWFCGTSACFAGHACLLAGDKPLFEGFANKDGDWIDDPRADKVKDASGVCWHADDRAQALLGLSDGQAMVLFHSDNDLTDLRAIVAGLVEHGDVPDNYLEW
jgi:hypothetical protein